MDYQNIFVAKISTDGSKPIYLTDIGDDVLFISYSILGLAIGPDGSAHADVMNSSMLGSFWAITNLDPSGNVVGKPGSSSLVDTSPISDVAIDSAGNIYITGFTGPNSEGVTYKTDPTNTQLIWRFYGYGGLHIAVDGKGNVYLQGASYAGQTITTSSKAFQSSFTNGCAPTSCPHQWVAAIDATGSNLIYATYLTSTFGETTSGIAVDQSGDAYVVGSTTSTDYPVMANAFEDTFSALAPDPTYLGYSPVSKSLGT